MSEGIDCSEHGHRDLAELLDKALPYLEEQQDRLRSAFRIDEYEHC